MSSALQRYFALRVKNLFNYLDNFELSGSEVALHDFRVEMKKLKSLLRLLRLIYPKSKFKKLSHKLGDIFTNAGEIREYQILLSWLRTNQLSLIESTYFPKENMLKMISSFHEKCSSYKIILNEIIDHCNQFVISTNSILAEQYAIQLNAEVVLLLKSEVSISEWHDLRKLIKQWLYSRDWMDSSEAVLAIDENYSYYNKLQESIGHWHDLFRIKEYFLTKKIFLSQDIDIHKEFNLAWSILDSGMQKSEKIVIDLISKHQSVNTI